MKKIVFRVDSGNHIGIGHLMRCLTLAYEFKNLGFKIIFITKNHKGFSRDIIPDDYTVFLLQDGLSEDLPLNLKNDYATWLGESWDTDLNKTNLILHTMGDVDLVVLDHYALDEKYERKLLCKKVLVIDDLMNRSHYCDYLLDQNTSAVPSIYQNLTYEKKAMLFLGPSYALLKRDFLNLRRRNIEKRTESFAIKNILIFFGGGDLGGDCLKLAKSLRAKELSNYKFTFILNKIHPTFIELSSWASLHQDTVTLFSFVDNMANLITENDFFIGAGGSTSWERICLGIPSTVISVADNQVKISESLSCLKLVHYLGGGGDRLEWLKFFEEKLIDQEYFHEMSKRCFSIMDGNGALRVANSIMEGLE